MPIAKPTLARRLTWTGLFVGIVPLAALCLPFLRSHWNQETTDPNPIAASLTALAAGVLILLVLTWLLSAPMWKSLEGGLIALRELLVGVCSGDYGARSSIVGPGSEFAALEKALDQLLENQQVRLLELQLERDQSAALRESALQLIRECIYAREPLVKRMPNLASAYAAAAARKPGYEGGGGNQTVQGLVQGIDSSGHNRSQRENLRWTPQNVRVAAPVPSKLLNMSVSGMAVESDRGLAVGGAWVFRIGTELRSFDIPGKICWCRLEGTEQIDGEVRPVYHTGVEFDGRLPGRTFDFFSRSAPETSRIASATS